MTAKPGNNAAPQASRSKTQKRADALRENLLKRKEQTRARKEK